MISIPENWLARGLIKYLRLLLPEFREITPNENFYKLVDLKNRSQDDLLISFILIRIVFRYAVFKLERNL